MIKGPRSVAKKFFMAVAKSGYDKVLWVLEKDEESMKKKAARQARQKNTAKAFENVRKPAPEMKTYTFDHPGKEGMLVKVKGRDEAHAKQNLARHLKREAALKIQRSVRQQEQTKDFFRNDPFKGNRLGIN